MATKSKTKSKNANPKKSAPKGAKADAKKLDETGRRKGADRRKEDTPVAVERRKNKRRRQIDPTTCEREYNEAEIEFMQAMDEYKRASGRMFPTCSEILEVLTRLGYRKVAERAELYNPDAENGSTDQGLELLKDDTELEEIL